MPLTTKEKEDNAVLITFLRTWFKEHAEDSHIWTTPVGRVIRSELQERGNWKAAPRSDPSKARASMKKLIRDRDRELRELREAKLERRDGDDFDRPTKKNKYL